MDYLVEKLPDYEAFGVGRDDGGKAGEFSAIFLRRERLERDPEEGGTYWFSDTPGKAGSKGWGNKRSRFLKSQNKGGLCNIWARLRLLPMKSRRW